MDPSASSASEPVSRATVTAVVAGDARAIDVWYRSEHPQVYRLCAGFLADTSAAEDLAQDAMLHLLDRLDGWSPLRPYSAWRNTVVLNLCRDRLRRDDARRRAHTRAAEARADAGAAHVLPDPASEAECDEVREVLLETLSELSPREREAFVLRDLEGRSTVEVAATLGVGESSVRSLLALARRRLRGLLERRLPGVAGGGEHV